MASGRETFHHASGPYRPSQGEVIYEHSAGQCDSTYDNPLVSGMTAWLSQAPLYDNKPITTGQEPWLHWSQCMWSLSTQIGCARAFGIEEPYQIYVVCRFTPEGNV
ncbi:hypothetical protein S7711_05324 [Stachybotrys chartarum IBT 7711]|uniref:SCP domain-containing protein n=1 Tax=Stachybotrys chartarum (strain CBS 109288 / IBT 7711) TaxID=1280523 RepID=A0A084ALH5_STACB|nr:hypothetical protein S7711_05324 [Stachybotrys chartarum IBT 7711]KFA50822.1 hypothetical protein S40293_05832 [Stachybotrys chartarum IBT 40293]KFA73340.1 hypothetical protein S40288_03915 [Stachybotrys chartarum IBT 40288]